MGNDRLTAWWNSLSDEQQAAALAAQRQGRLTPALAASLDQAGAIGQADKDAGALPTDVERFLKARH